MCAATNKTVGRPFRGAVRRRAPFYGAPRIWRAYHATTADASVTGPMTEPSDTLRREFGDIDIYLFDQLHRGNITIGMRVLDAGFGHGRNLVYLLRQGFDVSGVDMDAAAIDAVRRLVRATHADADARFRAEPV